MRVLAWVHLYAPDHCAGAEMMLHEILLGLRARGHDVHVICDSSTAPDFEGVPITTRSSLTAVERERLLDWADIVITHLDRTREVVAALAHRRPLVHLVHNDRQLTHHRVKPNDAQLVVANSQWIAGAIKWPGETIVVPPPVDPARYRTPRTDADSLTLVNLSAEKGARTFWALASALPDRPFLGVVGGYGPQVIPSVIPSNVTIVEHGPDIAAVYARTRILLMPSGYESWGRVGIEAAASGIPTIAHPTPGLLESLGSAGIFADRNNTPAWVETVLALDDPDVYACHSRLSLARSAALAPGPSLDRLEQAMMRLAPVPVA